MENKNYVAPEIEVVEVAVEQGFAASPFEDIDRNPTLDW